MEKAVYNNPGSKFLGHMWSRRKLLFHSDNHSIVDIQYSVRAPLDLQKSWPLYFIAARYNFNIMIPGASNLIADPLSHFQNGRFCQLAPEAQPLPDPILA